MVAALEDVSHLRLHSEAHSIRGAFEPHFKVGTCLAVQCYYCRGQRSTPGLGPKILHPTWHTQKQKNENSEQN